jgi:hypothetical protein
MADGIIFRTTDMMRWGAAGGLGTGGNLTQTQFDENNWEFLQRIQALEGSPPEAVSIEDFTVIGSQLQVNMTDGSTRGPYQLPVAMLQDVGNWVNDAILQELNLVTVPDGTDPGIYMVKIAHTTPPAPAIFDKNAIDEDTGSPTFGDLLYQVVFMGATGGGGGGGSSINYEYRFHIVGTPGDGQSSGDPIWWFRVKEPFVIPVDPLDWDAAVWYVSATGDGSVEYPVNHNGVTVASIFFDEEADTATILRAGLTPVPIDVIAGDIISVIYPLSTPSVSLKNLAVRLTMDPPA